jgi:hypothetical protein
LNINYQKDPGEKKNSSLLDGLKKLFRLNWLNNKEINKVLV